MTAIQHPHWQDRPVLVTGGSGFGGSHLVNRLIEAGARVTFVDRNCPGDRSCDRAHFVEADIRYQASFQRLLDEREIDTVFHLAAQPLVPLSLRDPAETWSINLDGTLSVLEAMRRSRNARRLVFASSGAVYGSLSSTEPIAEEHPAGPLNHAYAASKVAAEAAVHSHATAYDLKVVSCRFMNTYGPGDRHFCRLVPGAIQRLIQGEPYDFGDRDDGSTELDFLHVDDMARAYLAAGENIDNAKINGATINFGSAKPVRISKVVCKISQAFDGIEREPTFRGAARKQPLRKSLDISKASDLLDWNPHINFESGVSETVAWYRQKYSRENQTLSLNHPPAFATTVRPS